MNSNERLSLLHNFTGTTLFVSGMKPLSRDAVVKVEVEGESFFLTKPEEKPVIIESSTQSPNITFRIPERSLEKLVIDTPSDLGQMGIAICRLLLDRDPLLRASVKVHVGLFDLMRLGYLSVLTLGGPSLLAFLASHGMSGLGKIKRVITSLRETDGKR